MRIRSALVAALALAAALGGCTSPPAAQEESVDSVESSMGCAETPKADKPGTRSDKRPGAATQRSDDGQSDCPTCPPPC